MADCIQKRIPRLDSQYDHCFVHLLVTYQQDLSLFGILQILCYGMVDFRWWDSHFRTDFSILETSNETLSRDGLMSALEYLTLLKRASKCEFIRILQFRSYSNSTRNGSYQTIKALQFLVQVKIGGVSLHCWT